MQSIKSNMRIECNKSVALAIPGLKWYESLDVKHLNKTCRFLTSGDKITFNEMHNSQINPQLLRFIISDFDVSSHSSRPITEDNFTPVCSIMGRQITHSGKCKFLRKDVSVYFATYQSNITCLSVDVFFMDDTTKVDCIANIFFYFESDSGTLKYNPYIVLCGEDKDNQGSEGSEGKSNKLIETISRRRENAVNVISIAFLRAKFNPKYKFCKYLLCKNLDEIELSVV